MEQPINQKKDSNFFKKLASAKGLKVSITNPLVLFILLVLVYVGLDFISMAGKAYVIANFSTKAKHISWVQYLWISALIFLFLYVITSLLHISLISIETEDV